MFEIFTYKRTEPLYSYRPHHNDDDTETGVLVYTEVVLPLIYIPLGIIFLVVW